MPITKLQIKNQLQLLCASMIMFCFLKIVSLSLQSLRKRYFMVQFLNFGVRFYSKEVFIVMFTYSIHVLFQVGLMEAVKQEISCQQDEEELPTKSSCCIHGMSSRNPKYISAVQILRGH